MKDLKHGQRTSGAALEKELEALDRPAILLDPEYRIVAANSAYRARYGRAPRLGDDRCFALSHGYSSPCDQNGEDCPIGRARLSKRRERVFHVHLGRDRPEHVDVELRPILDAKGDVRFFLETIETIEEASAGPEGAFVGRSRAFIELVGLLRRAAPSQVPILLLGESGTGKELAARAIHDASPRSDGPFVAVECSGLGESLFESELFGHVKGAFTGAQAHKPGLVEAAAQGTLFLDEIGDVPLSLQVKLLRLLESNTYRSVGEVRTRKADFRLVCATHRNLDAMVAEGTFRQDLYYRINTFPVPLPPLRARREDVPLLSEVLLQSSGRRLAPEALEHLLAYDFPGNVRELRNILDRAVLLADGEEISVEHLPSDLRARASAEPLGSRGGFSLDDEVFPLEELERRYLVWAETRFEGDRRALAKALGLSERTLYRKLQALREDEG